MVSETYLDDVPALGARGHPDGDDRRSSASALFDDQP